MGATVLPAAVAAAVVPASSSAASQGLAELHRRWSAWEDEYYEVEGAIDILRCAVHHNKAPAGWRPKLAALLRRWRIVCKAREETHQALLDAPTTCLGDLIIKLDVWFDRGYADPIEIYHVVENPEQYQETIAVMRALRQLAPGFDWGTFHRSGTPDVLAEFNRLTA